MGEVGQSLHEMSGIQCTYPTPPSIPQLGISYKKTEFTDREIDIFGEAAVPMTKTWLQLFVSLPLFCLTSTWDSFLSRPRSSTRLKSPMSLSGSTFQSRMKSWSDITFKRPLIFYIQVSGSLTSCPWLSLSGFFLVVLFNSLLCITESLEFLIAVPMTVYF